MQMTEEEICKSFKEAKDHRKQVSILADLNCCSKDVIRSILMKNGIDPPRTGNRYTAKKEESESTIHTYAPLSVRKALTNRITYLNVQIKDANEAVVYHQERAEKMMAEIHEIKMFLAGLCVKEEENEQEQSNDTDEV